MSILLAQEVARALVRERQDVAVAVNRAARIRAARRWQRRAEHAAVRARRARLALR